uniref:BTB domain-containing protein n=1 Tax=Arcella intermedia TaxID=1963864 RepID=A0A6B2L5Y1_9EUKA
MWGEGKYIDVTFIFNGEASLGAHKAILDVRSPVFRAMFASGFQEAPTSTVKVSGYSLEAFKEFLHFVYCDKVNLEKDTSKFFEIWRLSQYYLLPELSHICLSKLPQLVDMFFSGGLLNFSLDFMMELLQEMSYQYVPSEEHLVEQLIRWSKHNGVDMKNFVHFIFPLDLSTLFLFEKVKPLGIYSAEQLNGIIQEKDYPSTVLSYDITSFIPRKRYLDGFIFAGKGECVLEVANDSSFIISSGDFLVGGAEYRSIIFSQRFSKGKHTWRYNFQYSMDSSKRILVGVSPSERKTGDIYKGSGIYFYCAKGNYWQYGQLLEVESEEDSEGDGEKEPEEVMIEVDMDRKELMFSFPGSEDVTTFQLGERAYHPAIAIIERYDKVSVTGEWVKKEIMSHRTSRNT